MFLRIYFVGILWLLPFEGWTQGTTFTYQGRLRSGEELASGQYALSFALYDQPAGGQQQGASANLNPVAVSNGLFTVELDFGAGVLNGEGRWLEIAVLKQGDPGMPTVLQPRQPLNSVPYATRSATTTAYSGAITDAQLSGNVALRNADQVFSGAVQFASAKGVFQGSFIGDGAGLTNVSAVATECRSMQTGRISGLPTSSSTSFYGCVSGMSVAEMSESSVATLSPNVNGTAGDLRVQLNAAPGTGKGYVIMLRVNGVDTSLAITLTGGQTVGDSGTNSVAIPVGAQLSFKVQAIGAPSAVDRALLGWTWTR